ncbi:TPA: LysR family transcriptional regulator [Klebsiella pneumoniae subsp. pneumoniae]|nr:LysR family transcriptional regulator [Klebsiella pneumoniae subsp. pneumoniae]
MDRFDAMRAFARVVEAGSFTKAAQTLHMSKTTVTQLIQQLEIAPARQIAPSHHPQARCDSRWRGLLRTRHPSAGGHGGC